MIFVLFNFILSQIQVKPEIPYSSAVNKQNQEFRYTCTVVNIRPSSTIQAETEIK